MSRLGLSPVPAGEDEKLLPPPLDGRRGHFMGHEEQAHRDSVALPANVPTAGRARPRSQYETAYNPEVS